jgi:thymidylate synthase (FAD)
MIQTSVLDHGFVKLRNLSGPTPRRDMRNEIMRPFDADDRDPAQAARMSFDQMDGDRTAEEDHRLSRYLMKNWHTSPFEMVECWLEMKLPIFVARQFVRHRTVSINEVSGRYVTLPQEWYIPEIVGGKAPSAKQGQADNLPEHVQEWFKETLDAVCYGSYARYTKAIEEGVAPEHARLFLHVNHYTHWLWKQDLHNILNFLRLRDHSHAQIEAQIYARAIDEMLRRFLPNSMALYDEFRRLP